MELFCYTGKGGEFCIGKLTEEQTDFVFENGENEEYDLDSFGKIMKLWKINLGMILMKLQGIILLN